MTAQDVPQPHEQQSPAVSDGMTQGMRVLSSLIAGVLLYGGLGWLGDHFLGTGFLLPLGIVLGAAFGAYMSIKRLNSDLNRQPQATQTLSAPVGTRPGVNNDEGRQP